MNERRFSAAGILILVAGMATAAACTSKSSGGSGPEPTFDSGPEPSFDSGGLDVTFADDSSAPAEDSSAPLEASGAADATAACIAAGMQPDGACNDLDQADTTPVTGTCGTGAQPAGTGGTIADGTYLLSAQARYIDAGCSPATFEVTMILAGGCFLRIDGEGASVMRRSGTYATSGNVLTRDVTCGLTLPAATYTATDTQLVIFDEGGSVTTWTKQ